MKPIFAIISFALLMLLISGCTQPNDQVNTNTNDTAMEKDDIIMEKEEGEIEKSDGGSMMEKKEYVILITDAGFSPNKVTIKSGDSVKWMNENSSVARWPATAQHPTHEKYPGSSITKCKTSEEKSIFDACGDIKAGQSYSFTFNEKGTWGFHDHSNAGAFGQVIVE